MRSDDAGSGPGAVLVGIPRRETARPTLPEAAQAAGAKALDHHDARQSAEERRQAESVVNARSRIALVGQTLGTRHPDYATSLNQLALLLIMQGEPAPAEMLLFEALDIRREAFGTMHPDYATNLSSLGGLLWARGDLDASEALLMEAMEVRRQTLGPTHPKTIVSESSLEQLRQARRELVASQPEPATSTTSTVEPMPGVAALDGRAAEIARRQDALSVEFRSLGERLASAVRPILNRGLLPDAGIADELRSAGDRFRDLVAIAREFADAHGVTLPVHGIDNLETLLELIPSFEAAERHRNRIDGLKHEAGTWLDRVAKLGCPADPAFCPLSRCRDEARSLRSRIASAGPLDLPPEIQNLAEGAHPLASLLGLAGGDDSVDDAEWARWFEIVEKEFGRSLAVAAARSKLSVSDS